MQITKPSWKILKKWAVVECVAMPVDSKPKPDSIPVVLPDYIICQQPLLPKLEKFLTQRQKDNMVVTANVVAFISAPDLEKALLSIGAHQRQLIFDEGGLNVHYQQ